MNNNINKYSYPDSSGHFEEFGGRYVPETLIPALNELEQHYLNQKSSKSFKDNLKSLLKYYGGRETPLYLAKRISKELNYNVWLKREDLNHTGAHKINNALGQMLLAIEMKKTRIIAETGAGQHGVATAACAAKFGLKCTVYMGEEDIERQKLNVFRMNLMGAEIIPVTSGSKTLKDATNEAIRDWVTNVEDTFYIIGSSVGPHPYPMLVRDFQSVIGQETKKQFKKQSGKKLPDRLVACVGGGSNALGLFHPFINDKVKIIGVEAAGRGVATTEHAATLSKGKFGVLHGAASYMLQDENGQVTIPYSLSAGLDYPGVGPEHSFLHKIKRVDYHSVTDDEAVKALQWLSEKEGIIPALETAHALAYLLSEKNSIEEEEDVIINLSGRGDKDVNTIAKYIENNV